MFVILEANPLAWIEFGEPIDPMRTAEAQIRWIMAEYEIRREEIWDVEIDSTLPVLLLLLDEAKDRPSDLIHVLRALGDLGAVSMADVVAGYLGHPDLDVRVAAIESLGRIGALSTLPRIEPFLGAQEYALRRAAIVALGKSVDDSVLPRLKLAAAQDKELQALVEQATRRIAALTAGDFPTFVNVVLETEEYEDLFPLMEASWEPLTNALADRQRSPIARLRAARLLRRARIRQAGRVFVEILDDPHEQLELRVQAVLGVGRSRIYDAMESLTKLLQSPELGLQEAAVTSLGQLGQPRALGPLLSIWDARGGALRKPIRLAVRRLCAVSGRELLKARLSATEALSTNKIYFIDDALRLSRVYRADLVDVELKSRHAEARQDAALLVAFFGKVADVDKLARMAESDKDTTNREIAKLGATRLRQNPAR